MGQQCPIKVTAWAMLVLHLVESRRTMPQKTGYVRHLKKKPNPVKSQAFFQVQLFFENHGVPLSRDQHPTHSLMATIDLARATYLFFSPYFTDNHKKAHCKKHSRDQPHAVTILPKTKFLMRRNATCPGRGHIVLSVQCQPSECCRTTKPDAIESQARSSPQSRTRSY